MKKYLHNNAKLLAIAGIMASVLVFSSYVSKSGVRLFPYYLLTYIMPPLYKR